MRGKKIGIIIIIIILILAIVAGVTTYLFLKTDVFKSNKQLFYKYTTQAIEQVEKMTDSKTIEKYKEEMKSESYETNTSIDFKYSEGGEVSSGYNKLNINMKTQKEDEYNYKNAQILFGDKSIVQVEGIQDQSLYGIRFTNIFNQFVTLQDGKNIEGLDLTDENLKLIKNIIEDNEEFYNGILFSKQDYQDLKEKYLQIIVDILNTGTFSKQNNTVITINSQTVKVKEYSCKITGLQVQNLIIKLLDTLRDDDIIVNKIQNLLNDSKKYEDYISETLRKVEDTEFSEMKIVIYEQKGKTIRTDINIGKDTITIESSNENGKEILKVKHEELNNEKEVGQEITISKATTETNEQYILSGEKVDGDEKYTLDATIDSDYKNINLNLDFYKDIVNINVKAQNSITNTINQKVELGTTNNIVANNLSQDVLKVVVDKMKSAYKDTLVKRYELLVKKLRSEDLMSALKSIFSEENFDDSNQIDQTTPSTENQITKEEINRFNAKFEFYSGTDISAESVKELIDVVKDNLESVNITPIETTQSTSSDKVKESIKMNIKKDNQNVDLANGVAEKIDLQSKYNITINYNQTSGIIESITIIPSK